MSSVVVVVPSPRFPVSTWTPQIQGALSVAKVRAVEKVRVLGDNVPGTATWVANPVRSKSGVAFEAVVTDWADATPAKTRNEALLAGAATVVVLGHVMTSSAKHALGRVFGSPRFTVVQVIDGEAKLVGRETIQCAPGYEIPAQKVATPTEEDGWSSFAPKAKAKK